MESRLKLVWSVDGRVCQVEALNVTLSDNSLALMQSEQRISQLQQLIAASEHDRSLLQERLDTTRSDLSCYILRQS